MAIAYDTISSQQVANPATSLTWSHTVSAAGNPIIFVDFVTSTTTTVVSVTYNGVALSQISSQNITGDANGYMYALVNPATGAHNVVITMNASGVIVANSISYTGVYQSAVPSNTNATNGLAITSISTSVNVAHSNSWLVGYVFNNSANNVAGTNTTVRNTSNRSPIDSNATQSVGSHSLGTSWTGSGGAAIMVAELLATSPSSSNSAMLAFF